MVSGLSPRGAYQLMHVAVGCPLALGASGALCSGTKNGTDVNFPHLPRVGRKRSDAAVRTFRPRSTIRQQARFGSLRFGSLRVTPSCTNDVGRPRGKDRAGPGDRVRRRRRRARGCRVRRRRDAQRAAERRGTGNVAREPSHQCVARRCRGDQAAVGARRGPQRRGHQGQECLHCACDAYSADETSHPKFEATVEALVEGGALSLEDVAGNAPDAATTPAGSFVRKVLEQGVRRRADVSQKGGPCRRRQTDAIFREAAAAREQRVRGGHHGDGFRRPRRTNASRGRTLDRDIHHHHHHHEGSPSAPRSRTCSLCPPCRAACHRPGTSCPATPPVPCRR